eukprot:scaffold136509_cov50-Prasinocladus_malaysianus.AAC.2
MFYAVCVATEDVKTSNNLPCELISTLLCTGRVDVVVALDGAKRNASEIQGARELQVLVGEALNYIGELRLGACQGSLGLHVLTCVQETLHFNRQAKT